MGTENAGRQLIWINENTYQTIIIVARKKGLEMFGISVYFLKIYTILLQHVSANAYKHVVLIMVRQQSCEWMALTSYGIAHLAVDFLISSLVEYKNIDNCVV